jgi:GTP-binding protein
MFYLVDLPGYGYAKASLQERAKWGKMIEKYLSTRDVLRAVVLLVDIRHAPTKDDVMMYEWIVANGLKPIIVATKLDKIKRSQKDKNLKIVRETLGAEKDVKIVPYSSETKAGRDELLMILNELLV